MSETLDQILVQYDALEAEGNQLAKTLSAAGAFIPIRPYASKFSAAIGMDQNFSPDNVILALTDYLHELRSEAQRKGLVAQSAKASKSPTVANARTGNPSPAPQHPPKAATASLKGSATAQVLTVKGVNSLDKLPRRAINAKNPSMPVK